VAGGAGVQRELRERVARHADEGALAHLTPGLAAPVGAP